MGVRLSEHSETLGAKMRSNKTGNSEQVTGNRKWAKIKISRLEVQLKAVWTFEL
jgi:hypothetical protein